MGILDLVWIVLMLCFFGWYAFHFEKTNQKGKGLLVESEKQIKELLAFNKNLLETCHELKSKYVSEMTVRMVLSLILARELKEYEKSSFFYNRLVFLGVPKKHLENVATMNKFMEDCLNMKYDIIEEKDGSPYKFQFVPSQNKRGRVE